MSVENDPRARRAEATFGAAKTSVKIYGGLTAAALVAVSAAAITGHPVNTFMWVRAVLLPAVAVLLYRLLVSASRGSRRSYGRAAALAVIMPIAIIGIDLIPGVCPLWYAITQAVCMLPVIVLAILTRRSALREAFPGTH